MTKSSTAGHQSTAIIAMCDQSWASEDGDASPCYADAVVHVHGVHIGRRLMCAEHASFFPKARKFSAV